MALEDLIERCIEEGVTHFELHDFLEGCDGERVSFHWDVYRGDPVRWLNITMPWDIMVTWLGFGPNPNKLWNVMPFSISFCSTWLVGVYTGGKRHGMQTSERPTLEAGLRAALGNYLCEGEDPCPHEICEFHGDCGWGE